MSVHERRENCELCRFETFSAQFYFTVGCIHLNSSNCFIFHGNVTGLHNEKHMSINKSFLREIIDCRVDILSHV